VHGLGILLLAAAPARASGTTTKRRLDTRALDLATAALAYQLAAEPTPPAEAPAAH
jgi:hypothetical protein